MTRIFRLVIAIALLTAPAAAFAQEEEGGGRAHEGGGDEAGVIYRKKTIVSFDDDTIDGNLQKPDGEYLEARKRVRHANLIRIRENFREKILEAVTGI
jgi:hypothetical protein